MSTTKKRSTKAVKKRQTKAGGRAQARTSTRAREAAPAATDNQVRTVKAQAAFLTAFALSGNVARSCRESKVGRRTIYDWLKSDAMFAKLYAEATDDAVDALEEEARRRAVDGVLKPVYQQGRKVGLIREYSDTLLITLLKGKRPDVYRERLEHTGKGGRPIETTTRVVFGGRHKPNAHQRTDE